MLFLSESRFEYYDVTLCDVWLCTSYAAHSWTAISLIGTSYGLRIYRYVEGLCKFDKLTPSLLIFYKYGINGTHWYVSVWEMVICLPFRILRSHQTPDIGFGFIGFGFGWGEDESEILLLVLSC